MFNKQSTLRAPGKHSSLGSPSLLVWVGIPTSRAHRKFWPSPPPTSPSPPAAAAQPSSSRGPWDPLHEGEEKYCYRRRFKVRKLGSGLVSVKTIPVSKQWTRDQTKADLLVQQCTALDSRSVLHCISGVVHGERRNNPLGQEFWRYSAFREPEMNTHHAVPWLEPLSHIALAGTTWRMKSTILFPMDKAEKG